MRLLAPSSDAPTPFPPPNEAANLDSSKGRETTSPKILNIAPNSSVPTVVLDTDVVSDNMAARLCISFLGHVLFLKNQVPFPIVQLPKIPTTDNTTRAAKRRHELLNSFDTLASHLYTTFIALSTALALRGSSEKAESKMEAVRRDQKHGTARAFFAVALGPTVGAARSRVIVGIDGLETRVWGLREDSILDNATRTGDLSDEGGEDEEGQNGDEDTSEEEEVTGSDEDASLPPSRSPSPSSSSHSDVSPSASQENIQSFSPLQQIEDPETVRAAERLLSRTLASACAEDDGHGLASEMAPTQTHVLLRAPRRFDHPCWIPRQNLCTSLDGYLADFLVESGEQPISGIVTKQRTKSSKVQGMWVKVRGGSAYIRGTEEDLAEEDEMIWWSWDGKLVGFTDW